MAQFASGTFTGTDGTELSAHDANWTKQSGTPNLILVSNRLRPSATGATYYYHAGTPASADYSVSVDVVQLANNTTNFGVVGRASTSAVTLYMARFANTAGWQLHKIVSGSQTQLGSNAGPTTLPLGTYRLKLDMVGSTIRLLVDDVETISVTDTSITDAGKAGIRAAATVGPSDTNGQQLDNFSADDAGGGATDTPVNPGAGTITITGYAPAVAQTTDAVDTSLTPGVGSIAITGYAPTIARTTLGTIVTPVLKNNTGTVLANETGVVVNVYHSTTGALVLQKTGLTSSALGVVTVTDDALEGGTTYAYEVVLSSNGRRLPTAEAA